MPVPEGRIRLHVEGDADRAAFARIAPPGVEVAQKRHRDEGGKDAMLGRAHRDLDVGLLVIAARDFDELDSDGVRAWAAAGLGADQAVPISDRAWGLRVHAHLIAVLGVGLPGEHAAFGVVHAMLDDYIVRLMLTSDGWDRARSKHGWKVPHEKMRAALADTVQVVLRYDLGMQASKRLHLLVRALVDEDVRPATLVERILAAHETLDDRVFAPVNADLAACAAWLRA